MRASVFMAGGGFARLQRRIALIEANAWAKPREDSASSDAAPLPENGRAEPAQSPSASDRESSLPLASAGFARAPPTLSPRRAGTALPFAIPRLDRLLAGGLRRAALHEMRSAESRDAAAATGFAVAVLARLAAGDDRPILWIVEAAAASEAGLPYGAGLAGFGLDPARLIVVRVAKAGDALWVFEEGLRCRGLAAVLTELRGNPRELDLTASRRLALRAREHGVMGLLVRQSDRVLPGAANTRWLVAPRPTAASDDFSAGIGHPAWRLTLERNRQGATGVFDVEWDYDRQCFAAAGPAVAADPRPVAPLSVDRPPPPPEPRKIVALPAAISREELPREAKRRRQWARG